MNQAQFLNSLKNLVEKKKWNAAITANGEIRLKKPYGRAFEFDPITAVCFDEHQKKWDMEDDALNAGKQLGLHKKTTTYICHACDFRCHDLGDEKLEQTRQLIANALNIDIDSEFVANAKNLHAFGGNLDD